MAGLPLSFLSPLCASGPARERTDRQHEPQIGFRTRLTKAGVEGRSGEDLGLLAQLYDREPQILGHARVAKLLGLADTRLVSGAGLVLAPDPLEGIA